MNILGYRLDQLTQRFEKQFGKGRYHAAALYREIFKFGNLDTLRVKEFIASPKLSKQLENQIDLSPGEVIESFTEDGLTKFITRLSDNEKIESVIIPMANRNTLCVSSQVGCRMGCRFCQTGKMGLKRNLTSAEIVGQLYNARFFLKKNIKNIVFMGMGEPFDNFDAVVHAIKIMSEQKGFDIALRYITVSTAGLTNGIEKLAGMDMKGLKLAVSINSADDKMRSWLMPLNKKIPLGQLKIALQNFPLTKRQTFLFEYILIKGLNDSLEDAVMLADYIHPLPVRLNLIAYNPIDGFNYESPSDDYMYTFADMLAQKGVFVVKRWSKGRSVLAGCGQLGKQC